MNRDKVFNKTSLFANFDTWFLIKMDGLINSDTKVCYCEESYKLCTTKNLFFQTICQKREFVWFWRAKSNEFL